MRQLISHRLQVVILQPVPLLALGLMTALREYPDLDVSIVDGCPSPSATPSVLVADHATAMRLVQKDLGPGGIVLIAHDGREHEIRRALEAGVHAYILLGCSTRELADAVYSVGRGARYLSPEVAQKMADSLSRDGLTGREIEVLRLLTSGCCNKTIASNLNIAVGTVKSHVKGIMTKLGARSRTQVVSLASQRGLIDEFGTAAV